MAYLPLKDTSSESRLFTRRVLVAAALTALGLSLLAGRLLFLQVMSHEHFTTLSKENRVKIVALPPARGLIFDRHGRVLAENLPAYRLEITPEQIEDLDATLAALGELIDVTDADRRRFATELKRKRPFQGVPLRLHLSPDEVARFSVNRHRFPGVDIEAHLRRHYPMGALLAHAVGYVGRISEAELSRIDAARYSGTSHIGKVGIEAYYEERLHGDVGYQQVETNAQGRVLRVLERDSPTPGRNLHLTLDAHLQRVARGALGEQRGAVVALDPSDGAVLALVSTPSFDPNAFVNGIDPETYAALQHDPDEPFVNRAIRGRYPPGSTIKPFIALAGLEFGAVRAERKRFCPGYYRLPGRRRVYHDWKKQGHGHVNLTEAIAQSCDVYFYDLARSLGIDRIHEFLSRFPLDGKTGVDLLPPEYPGLVPSRAWKRADKGEPWFPGETLITGIGQGAFLVTPVGLASATATLATRGLRVPPHVLRAVESPLAGRLEPYAGSARPPLKLRASRRWKTIIQAMVDVVHGPHGTARGIRPRRAGFRVAGKTGTAQVYGLRADE
ncbi:MAG: penicillin-binding protein 2, partial [Gammaproteobacteria bacterium]|nr:penicillin-binding protein 2 [Gammaproteobacteria bacterium]